MSAQSSNDTYALIVDALSSAGGAADGPSVAARTLIGSAAAGLASNDAYMLLPGAGAGRSAWAPPHDAMTITVRGTVDDPEATVTVNGVRALVQESTFRALGVPITMGANTITAIATDMHRNTQTTSIHVEVVEPQPPPSKPTLNTREGDLPTVTAESTLSIGGTKAAGTAIWMNGSVIVERDDRTTWSAAVTLAEGENVLTISARNAVGAASDAVIAHVTLDALPPVVRFEPPVKTNLSPVTLTGSVDDGHTTVTINGLRTQQTGADFEVSLSLRPGPNTLHLIATSSNGHVTQQDAVIVRGAIPIVESLEPSDGAKVYAGRMVPIRAVAADPDSDPVDYQIVLDGAVLADWSGNPQLSWQPELGQPRVHALTVNARDGFGGQSSKTVHVYVVHSPIEPD